VVAAAAAVDLGMGNLEGILDNLAAAVAYSHQQANWQRRSIDLANTSCRLPGVYGRIEHSQAITVKNFGTVQCRNPYFYPSHKTPTKPRIR
jgi:hypothetical protein